MNHAIPNNDNFNSTSILDWFKGNFSDYLSIQISGLKHAIWTPLLSLKNKTFSREKYHFNSVLRKKLNFRVHAREKYVKAC